MTNNSIATYTPQDGPLDLVAVRMDSVKYPRLKSIPPQASVAGLAKIVGAALAYTGRVLPEEDIQRMAVALHAELLQDYDGVGTANITLDELNYCVRRAVLGLGPEMYGINVASIYKVACDYCLHEGKQAQESANSRHAAERKKALAASSAGAMLTAYAGKMLNNNPQTHTK